MKLNKHQLKLLSTHSHIKKNWHLVHAHEDARVAYNTSHGLVALFYPEDKLAGISSNVVVHDKYIAVNKYTNAPINYWLAVPTL